jgi:tetratricopeptide (TPR) repeat protein
MARHTIRSACLAALLWAPLASACINTPATDNQGRSFSPMEYTGDELVKWMTTPRHAPGRTPYTDKIIAEARREPSFDHLTELGVLLIHQGKYADAARLFVAMERIFPGRYQTAANLGTTLELMGRDRVALRWIRIGMRRNPDSHRRTEWLHARILEAKIALAADPKALEGRSVAGVVFDPVTVPSLPTAYPPGNDGKPVKPHELDQALSYQLNERLQFVKPKDAVVASLLEDWATLNLVGGPVENAAALYPLAWRYGARKTALSIAREREATRVMAKRGKGASRDIGYCPICPPLDPESPAPPPRQRKPGDPPPPPPPPPFEPYRQ